MRGRLLRLAVVALLGFGAARIYQMYGDGRADLMVRYEAPRGTLKVVILDASGALVRRTTFGPDADRAHEIYLADGHRYTFRLDLGEGRVVDRERAVEGDGALVIHWKP